MSFMQTGTQMVKLRGGSKGLVRYFYVDEHKSCIRWRPSRKNERAKSKCLFPLSHSQGCIYLIILSVYSCIFNAVSHLCLNNEILLLTNNCMKYISHSILTFAFYFMYTTIHVPVLYLTELGQEAGTCF